MIPLATTLHPNGLRGRAPGEASGGNFRQVNSDGRVMLIRYRHQGMPESRMVVASVGCVFRETCFCEFAVTDGLTWLAPQTPSHNRRILCLTEVAPRGWLGGFSGTFSVEAPREPKVWQTAH